MSNRMPPLIGLTVLVLLSLLVATVLFGVLKSTGLLATESAQFGGAAAGFLATLLILLRNYRRMEDDHGRVAGLQQQIEELQAQVARGGVPPFQPPNGFQAFVDRENAMLLGYPKTWKPNHGGIRMQAMFTEDAMTLHPDDVYPGSFNVAVAPVAARNITLKELMLNAEAHDLDLDEVERVVGVELNDANGALEVPFDTLLKVLGGKGATRTEVLYDLNRTVVQGMAEARGGRVVRTSREIVDGHEALVVEWEAVTPGDLTLAAFTVVVHLPDTDRVFTFLFTDNFEDRDALDKVRRRVLSTVKFWNPHPVGMEPPKPQVDVRPKPSSSPFARLVRKQ